MEEVTFDALIALAGSEGPFDHFTAWALDRSALLVAADGGSDCLLRRGYRPNLVAGDLDSLSAGSREILPAETILLEYPQDKDYTDGELATAAAVLLAGGAHSDDRAFSAQDGGETLYRAFKTTNLIGRSFIFLNHCGIRCDHALANIALARLLVVEGARVYMTDGTTLSRILIGPASIDRVFPASCFDRAREESPGQTFLFSALPLDDRVGGLTVTGLRWGLDRAELRRGRSLALSNRAEGPYPDQVSLELETGTVMLFTYPQGL